ncbi:MAG: aquaporin family protein [Rhizobiaceae bacterium]|jgi:glycerol uptake facilitator-like aquaporin|nr:aquaporin family protein [Rhizobiaceae bacterium]
MSTFPQRLLAEFTGTALLLATVIGSGIMGETLAGGNVAIALLANTIATGAILFVLITALGPVSGAHFNPAVTLVFAVKREISPSDALGYVAAQAAGGLAGVLAAHVMFAEPLLQMSATARTGAAQWTSEFIAAFGLVLTILMVVKARAEAVAMAVGLYITAAYWFTASTSFANPAVTLARAFSDTFAGIRPVDVPMFALMQIIGALAGLAVASILLTEKQKP